MKKQAGQIGRPQTNFETKSPAVVISDEKVLPLIKTFRKQKMSYESIAKALNDNQVKSRRGKPGHTQSVYRVAKRAEL